MEVYELSIWWCSQALFMPRLIETCQPHKKSCQCQRTVPCVVVNMGSLFANELRIKTYSFPYIFACSGGYLQDWDKTYLFYNILKILLNWLLMYPLFSITLDNIVWIQVFGLLHSGFCTFLAPPCLKFLSGSAYSKADFQYHFSFYHIFLLWNPPLFLE